MRSASRASCCNRVATKREREETNRNPPIFGAVVGASVTDGFHTGVNRLDGRGVPPEYRRYRTGGERRQYAPAP